MELKPLKLAIMEKKIKKRNPISLKSQGRDRTTKDIVADDLLCEFSHLTLLP